jgi:thiosulfate/3-mercaptopyruvate sulfurtransferase
MLLQLGSLSLENIRMLISLCWLAVASASSADYPRPELLIEPTALLKAIPMLVLDVRDKKAYAMAHVTGAAWVDAKAWDRAFNAEPGAESWEKRLGQAGIDPRRTVVVYGDDDMRDAARIWWILRYWGIEDVRLLNGG